VRWFSVLILFALMAPAPGAKAAANLNASLGFVSSDAACESPVYQLSGKVDHTTNDSLGFDYIGVIWYDAGLDVLDNDFIQIVNQIKVPFGANNEYVMSSRFNNRPLKARVYDIGSPGLLSETSDEGAAFTASGILLGEFEIDPAVDFAACAARNNGRSLRSLGSVNNASQIFSAAGWHAVAIDGTATSIPVVLPDDAMLVAMFTTECAVDEANVHASVNLEILVDGVVIPPTERISALCTPGHALDRWTTVRAIGGAVLPPGGHAVTVRSELRQFQTGEQWRFDDVSTVILIPEPAGPWQLLSGLVLLGWLTRRQQRGAAGLLALLILTVTPLVSRAETNILHDSNGVAQTFADGSTHSLLLDGVDTTLVVAPVQAARLVITYSAECTVSANDTNSWLEIDIRIDGSVINTGDDAFCTSHGAASLYEWRTVSRTIQVDVPTGLHVIGVEGTLIGFAAGEQWRIDDSILSVLVIDLP
jgi:hypothetical protein